MNRTGLVLLADTVLAAHVAVIAFNVFGLIAIPVGAWRGWRFVRVFWWRALHLGILIIVAVQAVAGRACFLTLWWSELLARAGEIASSQPLIARLVTRAIYWPLPLWVFAALYVAVLGTTVFLWWRVPPQMGKRFRRGR
ncbi:MAG TPA: DUF2784 domain-containing protein [Alphaproteobacteria bacterium]|nr:DUF2784 domain-containing protein [Alphaproteobacteria bacterium]